MKSTSWMIKRCFHFNIVRLSNHLEGKINSALENQGDDSLSSILSNVDNNPPKDENHFYKISPSSPFSSSSNESPSSFSTNNSLITDDDCSVETNEDSTKAIFRRKLEWKTRNRRSRKVVIFLIGGKTRDYYLIKVISSTSNDKILGNFTFEKLDQNHEPRLR